ncbi:MAG: ArsA-related P-loop ATPase [Sulfolobales archaeon]
MVKHVVLVIGKGGVGKTTVSILLSLVLSNLGDTLLYSLDPAKHLIKYLGIDKAMKYYKVTGKLSAYQ